MRSLTRRELIEYLDAAQDLTFSYKGHWYFIGEVFDSKTGVYNDPTEYTCGRADTDDDYRYSSLDDALENFKIMDRPFKDILPDIDW